MAALTPLAVDASADGRRSSEPPPAAIVRVQSASSSLPIVAALANGYFTAENLIVQYSLFTSSKAAFLSLDDHALEIVVSSADNAVNYRLNPSNPTGKLLDCQIIFGHDLGLGLAMVALPGFETLASLRGQTIGVDVPGSGFALVAAKMMRAQGLEAGIDYTMVAAGGSPARLAGLLARPPLYQAAIINADSVVRAQADGLVELGTVADVLDPYLGGIGAASESWLKANPDVAIRFIRGLVRGMNWVRDREHRDAAVALLTDANTSVDLARQIYDGAVDHGGLIPRAKFNRRAFLNVLQLRQEFNGFALPEDPAVLASPASGLYDLSYYRRAVESDEDDSCESR
jgi:ABC-type nitrate/sulfonate/bicarbonate transport system substrate-binding protein